MIWLLTFLGFGAIIYVMKIKVNKLGYVNCRGDKRIIDYSDVIDSEKIEKGFRNCDVDGDCERGIDFNRIEEDVLWGDWGFCENGMEN